MRRELRIALLVMGALVVIGVAISLALQPELVRPPGGGGVDWRAVVFLVAAVALGAAGIVQGVGVLADEIGKRREGQATQPEIGIKQEVGSVAAGGTVIGVQHVHQPPVAPPFSPLHTLRAPVGDFTGRAAEVEELVDYLGRDGGTAAITGIHGMGGIGKTELALVVADRLRERYGDAGLMFELQPGDVPLTPEAVLASVIHALQPEAKLPEALAELQGVCRSALAGKRGLLLLDNAAGAEQVRPLLPAPAGWVVVVTSRSRFPLPGARLHDLELLPLTDAFVLLRRILSDKGRHDLVEGERGREEEGEKGLGELAERCGRLPLALRLAASYLGTYRDWLLPDYLAALERARLQYLDGVPGEPAVQAVLGVSIDRLRERDAVLAGRWEQLAVFPAAFDRAAAAAVWGELEDAPADVRTWPALAPLAEEETRQGLSALVQQSLLDYDAASGIYTLHDLLRECALAPSTGSELALNATKGQTLDRARLRHAWHYLGLGRAADALYKQGGVGVAAGLRQFEGVRLHLTAAWAALAAPTLLEGRADGAVLRWVNAYPDVMQYMLNLRVAPRERIAMLELAARAASVLGDRRGEGAHLSDLGEAYQDLGEVRRAIGYHQQVLAISREIGDRRGESYALEKLGDLYDDLGEARQAIGYFEEALAINREMEDWRGEAWCLNHLGVEYYHLGEARRAIEYYEEALAVRHEIEDRHGEAILLDNLGVAYFYLGEWRRAIELHEQALVIDREIGHRRGEGSELGNLGNVYKNSGNARRAIECYERARAIGRELGDWRAEISHLSNLGNVYMDLGEVRRAIEYYEQALVIDREIGDRSGEGTTLGNLGGAYFYLGEARRALGYIEEALAISREIGNRRAEGANLSNLGMAYAALREREQARASWGEALRIWEALESPNAEDERLMLTLPAPAILILPLIQRLEFVLKCWVVKVIALLTGDRRHGDKVTGGNG